MTDCLSLPEELEKEWIERGAVRKTKFNRGGNRGNGFNKAVTLNVLFPWATEMGLTGTDTVTRQHTYMHILASKRGTVSCFIIKDAVFICCVLKNFPF